MSNNQSEALFFGTRSTNDKGNKVMIFISILEPSMITVAVKTYKSQMVF